MVIYRFFTREGGVSKGIYAGRNCGPGSGDNPVDVAANRRLAAADLTGGEGFPLLTLHQIHSNKCVAVDTPWEDGDRPEADALVTDKPGLVLGILTADCGPVLFTGEKADGAPVIGAAHAGAKGALKGVLEATIKSMRALGAVEIEAHLGPCIGPDSYEVRDDFVDMFLEQSPANSRFFEEAEGGSFYFDLPSFIITRLRSAAINGVSAAACEDTYDNAELYYSYRRSTHNHEDDYGRQLSAIAIMR